MRSRTVMLALAAASTVAAITWATTLTAAAAGTATPGTATAGTATAGTVASPVRTRNACPSVAPPKAACFAEVVVGGGPATGPLAAPPGFGPAELTSAYQ